MNKKYKCKKCGNIFKKKPNKCDICEFNDFKIVETKNISDGFLSKTSEIDDFLSDKKKEDSKSGKIPILNIFSFIHKKTKIYLKNILLNKVGGLVLILIVGFIIPLFLNYNGFFRGNLNTNYKKILKKYKKSISDEKITEHLELYQYPFKFFNIDNCTKYRLKIIRKNAFEKYDFIITISNIKYYDSINTVYFKKRVNFIRNKDVSTVITRSYLKFDKKTMKIVEEGDFYEY